MAKKMPPEALSKLVYVNGQGQEIDMRVQVARAILSKKPKTPGDTEKKLLGWRPMGFPPERVANAEAEYMRNREVLEKLGRPVLGSFSIDSWMRISRPKAIRTKPYEIMSSAQQACDMAKKAGWLGCHVIEVFRGG